MHLYRTTRRIISDYKPFFGVPLVFILTYIVTRLAETAEDAVWAQFALRHIQVSAIWAIAFVALSALLFVFPFLMARQLARITLSRLSDSQLAVLKSLPRSGKPQSLMNHEDAAIVTFELIPAGLVVEDGDGRCFVTPALRPFLGKSG